MNENDKQFYIKKIKVFIRELSVKNVKLPMTVFDTHVLRLITKTDLTELEPFKPLDVDLDETTLVLELNFSEEKSRDFNSHYYLFGIDFILSQIFKLKVSENDARQILMIPPYIPFCHNTYFNGETTLAIHPDVETLSHSYSEVKFFLTQPMANLFKERVENVLSALHSNNRVRSALHWYYYETLDPTAYPQVSIVRYMIALEALLGDSETEISYKLALRTAAILLHSKKRNEQETFAFLRKLYKIRSSLVHGTVPDNEKMNDVREQAVQLKLLLEDLLIFEIEKNMNDQLKDFADGLILSDITKAGQKPA